MNCLLRFEVDRGEDLGVDDDLEPESDNEPSIGSPERFSQKQWAGPTDSAFFVDREADDSDLEEDHDREQPVYFGG